MPVRGDALTLGDIAGKITMLQVACRRCERHSRLWVARMIEQHGVGHTRILKKDA
jgi:hypothetical protein